MNEKSKSDFKPPRLGSWNGCGTSLLGASDRNMDGTFISTEWITFMFIPLIPLKSYRVRRSYETKDYMGKTVNFEFFNIEPLNIRQIRNVYAVFWLAPFAMLLVLSLIGPNIIFVIIISIIGFIMWFLLMDERIFRAE